MKYKFNHNLKIILNFLKYPFVIFVVFIILFPLFYLILYSFFSIDQINSRTPVFLPETINFDNYLQAFSEQYLPILGFTFGTTLLSVLLRVGLTTITSYGLFLLPKKIRKYYIAISIFATSIPSITLYYGLLSQFQVFNWNYGIGLINALILPNIFNLFLVLMFLQGFDSIPKSKFYLAKIDNLNFLQKLKLIYLPHIKTAIWVSIIFSTLAFWNNFIWPSIVLFGSKLTILNIWFRFIGGVNSTGQLDNVVAAGSVLTIIPLLITYAIFSQKINNVVAKLV